MSYRHHFSRTSGVLLLTASTLAFAQAPGAFTLDRYPVKPVRFISPFSAGGATDTVVSTPEAFAERIRIDFAKWRQVIEKVGLRKD